MHESCSLLKRFTPSGTSEDSPLIFPESPQPYSKGNDESPPSQSCFPSTKSKLSYGKPSQVKTGSRDKLSVVRESTLPKDFHLVTVPPILYANGLKPEVLMDPIAILRQCIRYFCSHPEVYGTDLYDLLRREVCYVTEIKAGEVSLIQGEAEFIRADQNNYKTPHLRSSVKPRARVKSCTTASHMSSLPQIRKALGSGSRERKKSFKKVQNPSDDTGAFGYGDVSFMPAPQGFDELLKKTIMRGRKEELGDAAQMTDRADKILPIHMWNLLHQASRSENKVRRNRCEEEGGNRLETEYLSQEARRLSYRAPDSQTVTGTSHLCSRYAALTSNSGENSKREAISGEEGAMSPPQQFSNKRNYRIGDQEVLTELTVLQQENVCRADNTGKETFQKFPASSSCSCRYFLIDTAGYEVSYLRKQISQLEAVYNSKCVQVHELMENNQVLNRRLTQALEEADRWKSLQENLSEQLKLSKKEKETWISHTNDMNTNRSGRLKTSLVRVSYSSHGALNPATSDSPETAPCDPDTVLNYPELLHEANEEIAQLNALWRETERGMQELRRAFENSENEANQTLNHISNAFFYIEQLERRIARRDAYIKLAAQRQASLEEKYEKLMWCCQELGTLSGTMSYADYLLSNHPIWSLFLFIRLQRHTMGYRFLSSNSESLKRFQKSSDLVFTQTPKGAVLVDTILDPLVVYSWLGNAIEIEKVEEAQRKVHSRSSRTSVCQTTCCRTLRWCNPFVIDYLNLDDLQAALSSSEQLKSRLSLLTVASLLFPLRNRDGTWVIRDPPPAADPFTKENAFVSQKKLVDLSAPKPDATEHMSVPNTREFNQSTLRFLLRSFWHQRLSEYKQSMCSRLRTYAQARKSQPSFTNSNSYTSSSVIYNSKSGDSLPLRGDSFAFEKTLTNRDELPYQRTFLSALVDFAVSVLFEQEPCGASFSSRTSILLSKRMRPTYHVQGTMVQNEKGVWSDGRIFFAVVLKRNPVSKSETKDEYTDSSTLAPAAQISSVDENDEVVSELPPRVREFFISLYHHTMEYKDYDADFRLFYLVSHQFVPEIVAINFFASLQALENSFYSRLTANLSDLDHVAGSRNTKEDPKVARKTEIQSFDQTRSGENAKTPVPASMCARNALSNNFSDSGSECHDDQARSPFSFNKSPVETLQFVLTTIDEAELIGENEKIEMDSDTEGYGNVFPASKSRSVITKVSPSHEVRETSGTNIYPSFSLPPATDRSNSTEKDEVNGSEPSGSAFQTKEVSAKQLKHSIRDYIMNIYHQRDVKDVPDAFRWVGKDATEREGSAEQEEATKEHLTDVQQGTPSSEPLPPEWTALDHQIRNALGPHASLIEHFNNQDPHLFSAMRKKRFLFNQVEAQKLAAARGLLPISQVLETLRSHCFSTYAVSCMGSPRFPLLDVDSMYAADDSACHFDMFHRIGQLPPTDIHLKRLRFALALDQPGSLIQPKHLFSFDPYTASPTHLYDEYLTLTLDVFLQQQRWLIDVVQKCCAARHTQFIPEGAGDCDGEVSIACLRRGFSTAFGKIGLGDAESDSFVDHLISYVKKFSSQSPMRDEQFTEAVWLVNKSDVVSNVDSNDLKDSGHGQISNKGDRWNLWHESEVYSILNLTFALRSSYMVWGTGLFKVAKALMTHTGAISVLSTPTGFQTLKDIKPPISIGVFANKTASSVNFTREALPCLSPSSDKKSFSIAHFDALNWETFENDVKETYTWTLKCLKNAKSNIITNPLRKTLDNLRGELGLNYKEVRNLSSTSNRSESKRTSRLSESDNPSSPGPNSATNDFGTVVSSPLMLPPEKLSVEACTAPPSIHIVKENQPPLSSDIEQDSSLYALGDILGLSARDFFSTLSHPNLPSSFKLKNKKSNKSRTDRATSLQVTIGALFQEDLLILQHMQEKRLLRLITACDPVPVPGLAHSLIFNEKPSVVTSKELGETQPPFSRRKSILRNDKASERKSNGKGVSFQSKKKSFSKNAGGFYPDFACLSAMEQLFNKEGLNLASFDYPKVERSALVPRAAESKSGQTELPESISGKNVKQRIPALCVPELRCMCAAISLM